MSEYADATLILHMHDAIAKIREYTQGGRDEFLRDRKTQDAVYRNLEIIGEAVKHLSVRMRSDHPAVEWQEAAKMRDGLIHDYAEINPTIRVVNHRKRPAEVRSGPGEDPKTGVN